MDFPRCAQLTLGLVMSGAMFATPPGESSNERPRIAVFAGPTATILNTDPPVTSIKARAKHDLPRLKDWFGRPVAVDTLYPQRLAAPVTVYVEQFSAHPLEHDSAELFAPPDGYLDEQNTFSRTKRHASDRPVYEIVLRPEDGLYPLPYMGRRVDGSAWDGFEGAAGGVRQTFYPDAARFIEELERSASVLNGNLSGRVDLAFFRPVPPGGYTKGLPEIQGADAGSPALPPETPGVDFFPYGYANTYPPRRMLAVLTNEVQSTLATGDFRGAIWLEGSPRIEDTVYWLNLLIDSECLIVGTAAQRPNHRLSADGPQNMVDAVDLVLSDAWRDSPGRNRTGAVIVMDQQILASREAIKVAPRPGGFTTAGGHGGVIGTTMGPSFTFTPNRRHGVGSEVNYSRLLRQVNGLQLTSNGKIASMTVPIKDAHDRLLEDAIPAVELVDLNDWMTADGNPVESADAKANSLVQGLVASCSLPGLIAASVQGGHFDAVESAMLDRIALQGIPVVKTFRGATAGFVYPNPHNLLIEGSNLPPSKARILLMACLLRYGCPPPAADPNLPTEAEMTAIRTHLAKFQAVFDTH